MKIISFCLWGENPKYTIGSLKNIELAKKYYPDWICRFHCDESVPKNIIEKIANEKNCEIFLFKNSSNWKFTLSRLFPLDDKNVELVIFRDADSRISLREQKAVEQWINSDKCCHIMRDHPYHGNFPILAGMFGLKNKYQFKVVEKINNFNCQEQYHYDQIFINKFIYPLVKDDCMIHDEFFEKNPFPTMRENRHFVGEVYDQEDNRNPEHYLLINS
jgi:protein O-GlcNAc transferase